MDRRCNTCQGTTPDVKFSRHHTTCNRCRAAKSRDYITEYKRKLREQNPEKVREYSRTRNRKHRAENPHLPFYTTSRYHAKKAGVFSDLTKEDAANIYYSPDICAYCGKERGPNDGLRSFHIDHVIPMSQGGPNSRWNLVKSCISCNTSKTDCSLINFLGRTEDFTQERYDTVIRGMAYVSGRTIKQINALLTQSHAFELAYEREKTKLIEMLREEETICQP